MMATSISNSDDLIDSRDVIERLAELAGAWVAHANSEGPELDEDEIDEPNALSALADEASQYATDWRFGATLVRDSYFVEYAQELAEDIGAINSEADWPLSYIDWDRAADALKADYTAVDFLGVTYWVR